MASTTKSELEMWEILSLNCTVLVVLNIVRLRHIIDYELCIHVCRTQSNVCIKDSERPFMNCSSVWRNVLAIEMLLSDLYAIYSCASCCLMNWESSVEEVQMTVQKYMAQYISGGHGGGFWCIEISVMQDQRGSVTAVIWRQLSCAASVTSPYLFILMHQSTVACTLHVLKNSLTVLMCIIRVSQWGSYFCEPR